MKEFKNVFGAGNENETACRVGSQAEKEFDAEKETENVVEWIKDFFHASGNGCNAIVAVSGGKDSSVVAALCVAALGRERVDLIMRGRVAVRNGRPTIKGKFEHVELSE